MKGNKEWEQGKEKEEWKRTRQREVCGRAVQRDSNMIHGPRMTRDKLPIGCCEAFVRDGRRAGSLAGLVEAASGTFCRPSPLNER